MFVRLRYVKNVGLWLLVSGLILAACQSVVTATPTPTATPPSTVTPLAMPGQNGVAITHVSFDQIDESHVGINVETKGALGVGLTIKVSYNDSPNADDAGSWHIIKELGVPKFTPEDRPILDTTNFKPGKYLVKVEVKTSDDPNWEKATVVYAILSLRVRSGGMEIQTMGPGFPGPTLSHLSRRPLL